jgi:hypothetical protein
MYDDDDFGFDMPDEGEIRRKMEKEVRKKFRTAAYKGYYMLVKKGIDAVDESDRESAVIAIRRILGLMQEEEEFERCAFLADFLKNEMGVSPDPMFDFNK